MHMQHIQIEKFWKEYRSDLLGFITSKVRDEIVAEDILHDVFLKIYQNLDSLNDESRLQAWTYSIIRNAINDHFRKSKSQFNEIEQEIPIDEKDSFDLETSKHTLFQSLQTRICDLPEPYREAVQLAEFKGLKHKEVAELQGISLHAAKTRVRRGREMLKKALLECCHFEVDKYGSILDMYPHKAQPPILRNSCCETC